MAKHPSLTLPARYTVANASGSLLGDGGRRPIARLRFFLFGLDNDARRHHDEQALGRAPVADVAEQTAQIGDLAQHRRAKFIAALGQTFQTAHQHGAAVRHRHGCVHRDTRQARLLDELGEHHGLAGCCAVEQREDRRHYREQVDFAVDYVGQAGRQRQTHETAIAGDDGVDGQDDIQGEQRGDGIVHHLAVAAVDHRDTNREELVVLDSDVGRLPVEQRQLGRLHNIGTSIASYRFHEQEHLNVAEECQAHRQAAVAGDAGVATKWWHSLRIGQLRDRNVQVARQGASRRQTGDQVVGGEEVDVRRIGKLAGDQFRLDLQRGPALVEDVHVEVDANTLEEILSDADELDLDGHFLIDQAPQGVEQILNLVLNVWRLIDNQGQGQRMEIDGP